ncbi:hypothetical protein [Erythrobacter oryzae]|uniref:hypothetical protein n=1 Tax=Erythrobacter oryzae TaxID=3019556 RepID=UPI002556A67C|nr:hypothetical protein [Erythrobacter sp. COR-2]
MSAFPALTLQHARAGAPFATKGSLAAALGWWSEGPGHADEWLLVPRLQLAMPRAAQSSPGALARRLDHALAAVRAGATVDPAPGTAPRGALRFTRRERWLAWLAVRLASPEHILAADCAPLPEPPQAMRAALRKAVAVDPLVLPAVTRALVAAGTFPAWAASWTDSDTAAIEAALTTHFAVPPDVLARVAAEPVAEIAPLPAHATPQGRGGPREHDGRSEATAAIIRILGPVLPYRVLHSSAPRHATLALLVAAIAAKPAMASRIVQALAEVPPASTASTAPLPRERVAPIPRGGSARAMVAKRPYWRGTALAPREAPSQPMARYAERGRARRESILARSPEGEVAHRSAGRGEPDPQAAPRLSAARLPLPACETRFGGLLFLLNAFTVLGLYPDFTRPLDPRIAPSPCWLLERIGMAWFGRRFARDPLRAWLAQRAVGGDLPGSWQTDPTWDGPALRPLRFRYGGYACAWDRRGFIASIAPLRMRDRQLRRPPVRAVRALRALPLETQAWLTGLLSYLDWRLAGSAVRRRDLCLAGTLVSSEDADEVTLRISLAQLPIALRLSGLDRDPGWIPAEGCNVRFEFT